ncbi:MAG TPA: transcription antitermination factor NusB, partial [Chthoniobacterales bacterium]|nr:transcription antitermination factor NusB [Chthoniobacterales bacterium]
MAQPSARRVALAALKAWRTKKEFADGIIARLLEGSPLRSADRAFALELFYGVLRNLILLDFWIGLLRPGRLKSADLRDAVRLGLYQLFISKTSEHAAVYETVELAPKQQRPVVNGILRSALRRRSELRAQLKSQPLDVRFSHPKFLIERWTRQFGEKSTKALCEWDNQPPPIYARINFLKIDRQSFLDRYREAQSIGDNLNFVELPAPNDALNQGHCYVQDPSTAIACELLEPEPHEKVLDACAAPGGKTSYLAELMQNQGSITACDRDSVRLRLVRENLARLGVKIASVAQHDWAREQLPGTIQEQGPFDRILVDAPCSNTGVMRR